MNSYFVIFIFQKLVLENKNPGEFLLRDLGVSEC